MQKLYEYLEKISIGNFIEESRAHHDDILSFRWDQIHKNEDEIKKSHSNLMNSIRENDLMKLTSFVSE